MQKLTLVVSAFVLPLATTAHCDSHMVISITCALIGASRRYWLVDTTRMHTR